MKIEQLEQIEKSTQLHSLSKNSEMYLQYIAITEVFALQLPDLTAYANLYEWLQAYSNKYGSTSTLTDAILVHTGRMCDIWEQYSDWDVESLIEQVEHIFNLRSEQALVVMALEKTF